MGLPHYRDARMQHSQRKQPVLIGVVPCISNVKVQEKTALLPNMKIPSGSSGPRSAANDISAFRRNRVIAASDESGKDSVPHKMLGGFECCHQARHGTERHAGED